jgi:hypothetical protein
VLLLLAALPLADVRRQASDSIIVHPLGAPLAAGGSVCEAVRAASFVKPIKTEHDR